MRAFLLFTTLSFLLIECSREELVEEKKTEAFEEVPPGIIEAKPCSTLYQGIIEMYPEHKHNNEVYANLFDAGVQKNIVLNKESEVYVSFISEGAGWSNTFGYYTYDKNNPPVSAADLEKKVLFPNVSEDLLSQGATLKIGDGTFPAGTVIGFFLIPRGYENGLVHYTKTTLYTDMNLNKGGYQQHLLFKEGDCSDIVLTFEDRLLSLEDCDFDYNDIIMTISDNINQMQTTAFDIETLVVL